MRFLRQSARKNPKISLILLDWSVRESFHLLHYLSKQTVGRDQFEVAVIEYYSREAEGLKLFRDQVDTWLLLEMPEPCIYHKHLMYNCGLVFARGEIVVLCDSDAMVKESFIQTILDEFAKRDRIVLHMDQFRNSRRDLYPFNYPSFEEMLGEGCINNIGGKTAGILDQVDPLHTRNYGACMCAKRADLVAIGGADEHVDYLGHICGPYDMTFRLVNYGLKEVWHDSEFLYHTWHPGQAGIDNYQGPHDGKQMSSTALDALVFRRVLPLVENKAMRLLRGGADISHSEVAAQLIDERYFREWDQTEVMRRDGHKHARPKDYPAQLYGGFKITRQGGEYRARRPIDGEDSHAVLRSASLSELAKRIDDLDPYLLRACKLVNSLYWLFEVALWFVSVAAVRMARLLLNQGTSHWLSRLFEFYESYRAGWLAMRQYGAYMKDWVSHVTANLYFMDSQGLSGGGKPVLLVTSRYVEFYLKVLGATRILPQIEILRLRGKDEIRAHLEDLSFRRRSERLILGRDIYTRHYALFQSFPQSRDALIL